jgi:hypothetical protein
MNETPKSGKGWRILRRIMIGLAIFATLVAIFYTEENWRGKRAWEQCKRELEAKGMVLDWGKFIPPPVPDDQNFFAAPKMQPWFVKNPNATTNELMILVTNADKTATIMDKAVAAHFLAWSDQFQPVFDSLRKALKRPYARMDGDYTKPYEIPIPHFVNVRAVAQALTQRAKCNLLLGQPDKALNELTLLNDSRRLMERAPTGKPITLVDAMVNVAVTGLYADTIAKGLRAHAWEEPQWVALQKQLEQIELPALVVQSFESEPAATTHTLETIPMAKLKEWFQVSDGKSSGGKISLWQKIRNLKWTLIPRGWIYQNMATSARLVHQQTEGCDPVNGVIQPQKFGDLTRELNAIAKPYKFFAAAGIPNFTKAWQTTAYNQMLVNQAQIACALERYRLSHGDYPETLDALRPQFIEKLPHDIIGGPPAPGSGAASQPLHYRREAGGKFLLYSVGWNEKDDGGEVALQKDGSEDRGKGDWVWQN